MRTEAELRALLAEIMTGPFAWIELQKVLLLQTEILLDIRTMLAGADPDKMMAEVKEAMDKLAEMRSS